MQNVNEEKKPASYWLDLANRYGHVGLTKLEQIAREKAQEAIKEGRLSESISYA